MKTITIKFTPNRAEQVGILLHSLELKTLATWTRESFMDEIMIYCVLKLNGENAAITPELQLEKLRERNYIIIL